MNSINQVKTMVGIDPNYDIAGCSVAEVMKAENVFRVAYAYHNVPGNSQDCAIRCALAEVWDAAKQYYAQHPQELHKSIVR